MHPVIPVVIIGAAAYALLDKTLTSKGQQGQAEGSPQESCQGGEHEQASMDSASDGDSLDGGRGPDRLADSAAGAGAADAADESVGEAGDAGESSETSEEDDDE